MTDLDDHSQFDDLTVPHGSASLDLRFAGWCMRLRDLSPQLAACLEQRWGGFAVAQGGDPADVEIAVLQAGQRRWLKARPAEEYRIERVGSDERPLLVSYHFALQRGDRPTQWRLALSDQQVEPLDRALENAIRFLVVRLALARGGFALHGAGVFHEGAAHIFAGPSRAGKTTAVALSAPASSLGDDYAVVLPQDGVWHTAHLPFDNSERAAAVPIEGLLPLAGMWRLFQAEETRIERPTRMLAVASLMSCVALPWAIPELTEALIERVREFVASDKYAHLHFTRRSRLWIEVLHNGRSDEIDA